ncbi:MAG: 1-deoxy-D-xylulose-5-phosphate reductoisomerase [Panacagrimonas sp.]
MSGQRLLVLGATGSVGRNTLDVAARHPERYEIVGLSARSDVDALLVQIRAHRPEVVSVIDAAAAAGLRQQLAAEQICCEVLCGDQSPVSLIQQCKADVVMAAISGGAGLLPVLSAIQAGLRVLIANKEPLVMAGDLMMSQARRFGAVVIPVDSEHNAIFQCLPQGFVCGDRPEGVRSLWLTASGGPFRNWSAQQMAAATPAQAVRHPNWQMGAKISVDSATLMNKGLELIEAAVLYRLDAAALKVVIHPQSTVHSLVEFEDGSILAQMGQPDMRIPIAHALGWPDRIASGAEALDLHQLGALDFEPPDEQRFVALRLARQALISGGVMPNVLNAINEVAVQAFLDHRIGFNAITDWVARGLEAADKADLDAGQSLEAVLATDQWARDWARDKIEERS